MQLKITLEDYTDIQLLSLHRKFILSHDECIEEFRQRGWADWKIELCLKANVCLREVPDDY